MLSDLFQSDVRRHGDVDWITLRGELDAATVTLLRDTLTQVDVEADGRIVVDLRDLTFIDSAGARELWRMQLETDRPVRIVGGSSAVMTVLEILEYDRLLDIVPAGSPQPATAVAEDVRPGSDASSQGSALPTTR